MIRILHPRPPSPPRRPRRGTRRSWRRRPRRPRWRPPRNARSSFTRPSLNSYCRPATGRGDGGTGDAERPMATPEDHRPVLPSTGPSGPCTLPESSESTFVYQWPSRGLKRLCTFFFIQVRKGSEPVQQSAQFLPRSLQQFRRRDYCGRHEQPQN